MNIQWSPASAGVTEIDLVNGAGSYVVYGMKPNGQPTNYNGSYSYQVAGIPAGLYNLRFYGIQGFSGGMIGQSGIITINPQSSTVTQTQPPTVTGISPGQAGAAQDVTISGNNLTSGGNPAIKFYSSNGSLAGTMYFVSMKYISAQSIVFDASAEPSLPPGTYQVYVSTSNGTSNAVTFTLTAPSAAAPSPTVTSISPGQAGAAQDVTISGNNLTSGGNPAIKFYSSNGSLAGTMYFVSMKYISAQSIVFDASAEPSLPPGTYQVYVSTSNGTSNAVTFTLTAPSAAAPSPTVTSISPGQAGAAQDVTISGNNLTSGGNPAIKFYSSNGSLAGTMYFVSMKYISAQSIVFDASAEPSLPPGTYQVYVSTSNGTSNAVTFTLTAPSAAAPSPTVTSITPSQGTANTTVTISGANLSGATDVDFYNSNNQIQVDITGQNLAVSADGSSLSFTLSGGFGGMVAAGTYQVKVVTPAGTSNGVSFSFTSPASSGPTVTLSPSSLSFSMQAASTTISPANGYLNIAVSPDQLINWTTNSSVGWITVNPPSYSPYSARAASVSINSQAATLAPGTYTGTVTFSAGSGGASFASQTVYVTLTVTPAPQVSVVTFSPSKVSFSVPAGAVSASPSFLSIAVSPDQFINWTTQTSANWIAVNPPSYSPYSARAVSISINAQAATLAPGTYTGTVTFSAGSGGASFASQTVYVTLTVTAGSVSMTPSSAGQLADILSAMNSLLSQLGKSLQ